MADQRPSSPPTSAKSPPVFEYVLLLVLATLWGSSFTFMKLAVESFPPLTMIALRSLLAAATLYVVMRWSGLELPRTIEGWRQCAVQAVLATVLPFNFIAWGIQYVDASLAVILNSTTPIFAFLITWGITRYEPATMRKLVGLTIGLAGILAIMGYEAIANLGAQIVPQASLVCGALCYAIAAIFAGQTFKGQNPLVPATGSLIVGVVILLPVSFIFERPLDVSPTTSAVIGLLGLSLLGTAAGGVLYYRLLGTLGAFGTTSQAYMRVPIGVLTGVVVMGDKLPWSAVAGLVCVVIGVAAMTMPPQTIQAMRRWLDRRLAAIGT